MSSSWVARLRLRWDVALAASHRAVASGWPFDPNDLRDCTTANVHTKTSRAFLLSFPFNCPSLRCCAKFWGLLNSPRFLFHLSSSPAYSTPVFLSRGRRRFPHSRYHFPILPGFFLLHFSWFYYPYALSWAGRAVTQLMLL